MICIYRYMMIVGGPARILVGVVRSGVTPGVVRSGVIPLLKTTSLHAPSVEKLCFPQSTATYPSPRDLQSSQRNASVPQNILRSVPIIDQGVYNQEDNP